MKMTVKLLEAFGENAIGDILEMDENMAKSLIKEGVAEAHDLIADGRAKAAAKKLADEKAADLDAKIKAGIAAAVKSDIPGITVKDNSDSDTSFGYCPNGSKASKGEKNWGAGNFLLDVATHGKAPYAEGVPERFSKCMTRSDEMIKAAGTGMEAGQDSLGGSLLPPAFSDQLLQVAEYASFVEPRAMSFPMSTLALDLPLVQDTDRSGGTVFGGVQVYFPGENEATTASRPKFEQRQFKLKKLSVLSYASHEILKFSPVTAGAMLTNMGGQAIAWKKDTTFYAGTGAGQPLGVLNGGAKITVSEESNQAASTIVYENILKMFCPVPYAAGQQCHLGGQQDDHPTAWTAEPLRRHRRLCCLPATGWSICSAV